MDKLAENYHASGEKITKDQIEFLKDMKSKFAFDKTTQE